MSLRAYYITPNSHGVFYLWEGYIESDSNLHYARYYGTDNQYRQIWVLERTDIPEDAIIIPIDMAKQLISNSKHY